MRRNSKVVLTGIIIAIMISGCSSKPSPTLKVTKENMAATTSMPTVTPVQEETLKVEQAPKFSKEDIRGIKVIKENSVSYELNYCPKEGKDSYLFWEMTVPYKSIATVDTEAMYRIYNSIASVDFTKPSAVKQGTDTGIQKSKTSLRILYSKDSKEVSAQNKATLIVGNKTKDGQYYCALGGVKDHVFLVDQILLDSILNQKPYNMILKVPYIINFATVEEVQIQYGNASHQMKMGQDDYRLDEKKVDRKEYCELYAKLMGLTIAKEIPKEEGTKKDIVPVISMKFIRNVTGAENCNIVIYAYDPRYCSVQVNGEEFFLVSKTEVDDLLGILKNQFKEN